METCMPYNKPCTMQYAKYTMAVSVEIGTL